MEQFTEQGQGFHFFFFQTYFLKQSTLASVLTVPPTLLSEVVQLALEILAFLCHLLLLFWVLGAHLKLAYVAAVHV